MNEALELDDQDDFDDLNNDDPNALPDHTRTKWIILGSLVALAAIVPIIVCVTPQNLQRAVIGVYSVANQLLAFTWIYFDSLEFGDPISIGTRSLGVFFGIFLIPVYLFRSRGIKYGMRAMGKMFIVFFAMIGACAAVTFWLTGGNVF